MSYNFIKWSILQEANTPKTLELFKLSYHREDLDPSISLETMNYHYGKLAKGYVDRYNSGEGDAEFNEAGAYLHNIFNPVCENSFGTPVLVLVPSGKITAERL